MLLIKGLTGFLVCFCLVRLVLSAVRVARPESYQKWLWDGQHLSPVAPEDDPEWEAWSKRQDSTGS